MESIIIKKLDRIEAMLSEQNLLTKEILTFNEAVKYLDVSHSHLYKLTSLAIIPFYKPNGKKLYFNTNELDKWLLSKRQAPKDEIEQEASQYLLKKGRIY